MAKDFSMERIAVEMGGDPSIPSNYSRKEYIHGEIADISTGEQLDYLNKVVGRITKFTSYLEGTLTGADAELKLQIGGVDVTGGALTIGYSGSLAGDIDEVEPTALNVLAENDLISVIGDGGSTDAQQVWFAIEITKSED